MRTCGLAARGMGQPQVGRWCAVPLWGEKHGGWGGPPWSQQHSNYLVHISNNEHPAKELVNPVWWSTMVAPHLGVASLWEKGSAALNKMNGTDKPSWARATMHHPLHMEADASPTLIANATLYLHLRKLFCKTLLNHKSNPLLM